MRYLITLITLLVLCFPAYASGPWVMMAAMRPASAPPSAPTGVAASSGSGKVALAWTASAGATSYKIYRGTSSGGESTTPIVTGVTAASYTDSTVINETTYYYTVKATGSAGDSTSYSNEAVATPSASLTNGLLDFETASLAPNGLDAYVSNSGPNTTRNNAGAGAHAGSYDMLITPNSTPSAQAFLYRPVTVPSSGSYTFTRWFKFPSSLPGSSTSNHVVFGMIGTLNSLNGSDQQWMVDISVSSTGAFAFNPTWTTSVISSSLTAGAWYKISVTLNCTNNTYSTSMYNASGTQVGSTLATQSPINVNFSGQSAYMVIGPPALSTSGGVNMEFDDITDSF